MLGFFIEVAAAPWHHQRDLLVAVMLEFRRVGRLADDALQLSAFDKRFLANLLHRGGDGDLPETEAGTESLVADGHQRVGEHQRGEHVAASESFFTDFRQTGWKPDRGHFLAVEKTLVGYDGDSLWNRQPLDGLAGVETAFAEGPQAGRQLEIFQEHALVECPRSDTLQAIGEIDMAQVATIREGVGRDFAHPFRDVDRLDVGAVAESSFTDDAHAGWDIDAGELAALKSVCVDFGDSIWDCIDTLPSDGHLQKYGQVAVIEHAVMAAVLIVAILDGDIFEARTVAGHAALDVGVTWDVELAHFGAGDT